MARLEEKQPVAGSFAVIIRHPTFPASMSVFPVRSVSVVPMAGRRIMQCNTPILQVSTPVTTMPVEG